MENTGKNKESDDITENQVPSSQIKNTVKNESGSIKSQKKESIQEVEVDKTSKPVLTTKKIKPNKKLGKRLKFKKKK